MNERDERAARAWRLAVLVTGDAQSAERVVAEAAARCGGRLPDDSDRADRLVLLAARTSVGRATGRARRAGPALAERGRAWVAKKRAMHQLHRGETPDVDAAPRAPEERLFAGEALALMDALGRLGEQEREAWALGDLDGREMLRVARAMDCSKTAAGRHLDQARERLAAAFGDGLDNAANALRAALDALDAAPAQRAVRSTSRRGRWRRIGPLAAIGAVALLAAFLIALVLLR